MKAICNTSELELSNGTFIKNPYVRPGKSIKDPINETFQITFDLCTERDVEGEVTEKVIMSQTLHFNRFETTAMILVDGVEEPLLPYLLNGGAYVEEDVTNFGFPAYAELEDFFVDSFGLLVFKETPLKWFAQLWGLKHIVFDGKPLEQNFAWE